MAVPELRLDCSGITECNILRALLHFEFEIRQTEFRFKYLIFL